MRLYPLIVIVFSLLLFGCTSEIPTAVVEATTDTAVKIVMPTPDNVAHFAALAKDGDNNGATRWIPDEFCSVFDWQGDFYIVDCVNQIATRSSNGNALVVTSASGIPNPTGKVVRWDYHNPPQPLIDYFGGPPSPCFLLDPDGGMLFTSNWSASVTPAGQAKFMCHYSDKWAVPNPWE
ncbi:MAG: hypothetical protein HKN37_15435 [Rhodothermales bacterium]|nr:hypothetical protein [Rhodothermales bacterium]